MKNKVIIAFLFICLLLAGCVHIDVHTDGGDNTSKHTAPSSTAEVNIQEYPSDIGTSEEKLLTMLVPSELFTTIGEDNGLIGNLFQIYGTVRDISYDDSGNPCYIHIRHHYGDIIIQDPYYMLTEDSAFDELGEIDPKVLRSYFPLPEVGEFVCFYAEYQGMSNKFNAPFFVYGDSDYMVNAVLDSIE